MAWNFTFELPTKIEFGSGKVNNLGEHIKELGGGKVLVVTDKGLLKSGVTDKVFEVLKNNNIDYVIYDEVKPNPRDVDCETAYELAKKEKVDLLIAVGGGSSMDTAKAVGTLLTHGGKIDDWYGLNKLKKPITPLICLPTTAGTGSEITAFAVITNTKTKFKMNVLDVKVAPEVAILDPELTITLPSIVTSSTGMDALTHAIEAYTCNVSEPLTDGLALHAIDLIIDNLRIAVEDGGNVEARENMLAASLMAGIAFGNADVAGVHCMAESLGGLYDTPHGIANSIFLPYVFEYNIPSDIKKHAIVAERLGAPKGKEEKEIAYEGVNLLKKLASDVDIPKFSDLDYVDPKDFPYLADGAIKNVSAPSNPREANKKDYLDLFEKVYQDK